MKYTILGSSGFVGSHLVKALSEQGAELFLPERGFGFSREKNLSHVIYCIGLTSDFRSRPMDAIKAHVTELVRVLESCSYESFLYLSSTRVYSGGEVGAEEQSLKVNPCDLSDLYNLSKLMGEAACFATNNKKVRVARLSNVVGNDFQSENFLFSLIREALSLGKITLGQPLDAAKDYVSIDDVVSALLWISQRGRDRLYNVASGENITNRALVNKIVELTGCKLDSKPSINYLKFPPISISRLASEFGYKPKGILENLESLIAEAKSSV